jgi:hypothetical protein
MLHFVQLWIMILTHKHSSFVTGSLKKYIILKNITPRGNTLTMSHALINPKNSIRNVFDTQAQNLLATFGETNLILSLL